MTNLDRILKSRDIKFANKGPSSQGYGFSSSHEHTNSYYLTLLVDFKKGT